jgi:hypothetical protein
MAEIEKVSFKVRNVEVNQDFKSSKLEPVAKWVKELGLIGVKPKVIVG